MFTIREVVSPWMPGGEGAGGRGRQASLDPCTEVGLSPGRHGKVFKEEKDNHLWMPGRGPVAMQTMDWREARLVHSKKSPSPSMPAPASTPRVCSRKEGSGGDDGKRPLGPLRSEINFMAQ
jgi:hypothetical protein